MSSGDTGRYRLSPRAFEDLDDAWRYSAEQWSIEQADKYIDELVLTFEMIAAMPTLARERREFTPPVQIHTHESHLIIYAISAVSVVILRLLGGRLDWVSVLTAADL
jgi:toxin ParE1/3/4